MAPLSAEGPNLKKNLSGQAGRAKPEKMVEKILAKLESVSDFSDRKSSSLSTDGSALQKIEIRTKTYQK